MKKKKKLIIKLQVNEGSSYLLTYKQLWPILLTWINLNPSTDK